MFPSNTKLLSLTLLCDSFVTPPNTALNPSLCSIFYKKAVHFPLKAQTNHTSLCRHSPQITKPQGMAWIATFRFRNTGGGHWTLDLSEKRKWKNLSSHIRAERSKRKEDWIFFFFSSFSFWKAAVITVTTIWGTGNHFSSSAAPRLAGFSRMNLVDMATNTQ